MPAIWNLHHEHCRIFQGHTFIGCVFSVGPRGFAPIGPSKFARGKGCKSHSLDWSEEKMKKAPCRFSKNPCWDTHTIIKVIPNERSRKLKIYEKDINEIWEGLIAYHSIVQKRCMAKLGGFASRKIMYVHRCDTTFTVAICAIWNCPIACVMICGSNGHAAEATNLWSQRIRKKKKPAWMFTICPGWTPEGTWIWKISSPQLGRPVDLSQVYEAVSAVLGTIVIWSNPISMAISGT